jgi:exopolysaccharide production protein ExoQ
VHVRALPALKSDVAEPAGRERVALICLFVLVFVAYAGLGRDVLFNRANCAVCYSRDARADLSSYDPIGFYLPYARILVCGAVISFVWARHGLRWIVTNLPFALAPFVALALASAAWADAPWDTLRESVTLLALAIALPLLIRRLGLADSAVATLHVIAAVAIASCILAIALPTIGRHTGDEVVQAAHAGRWRGLFGHKNGLGAWAAYGSVFLFSHSGLAGGWRAYWWLARGCAVACLVLAGSSTGLIMAATLAGAWLFLRSTRRLGVGPAVAMLLAPTIAAAAAGLYWQDDLLEWVGRDATFSGRTMIWDIMIDHFLGSSTFVQGLGAGYQSAGGMELALILENRFDQPMSPENSYLSLLLGVGVVGFVAFFTPYLASVGNAIAWLRHARGQERAAIEFALMTLLAVLVASFTEATALVSTGYDGVLGFGSLFALLTLPSARDYRRASAPRRPVDRDHGGFMPSAATVAGSGRPSASIKAIPPWPL